MDPEALVSQEYSRMALAYEERVAPRFAPLAARTVADARLQPGERVLDVGCGTGLATLLAAEQVGPGGEAVGVDFAEGQLGVAVGKAALRGLANVRFERADATRLRLEATFDAALNNLGLPADFAPVLAAMRRALKPGGRASLAVWDSGPSPCFDGFRSVLAARLVAEPGAELALLRRRNAERKAAHARLGTVAGLEEALRAAGFAEARASLVEYATSFAGGRAVFDFMTGWGWTEAEVRALPGPEREALLRDLDAHFGKGPFAATWRVVHATGRA